MRGLFSAVDQPIGFLSRVDDIGKLGLDAEIDIVTLGDLDGRPHGLEEIPPGLRRVVVGMRLPLVDGVACAGAERDQAGRHAGAALGQRCQSAKAGLAHGGIRMDHVEGAGNGNDLDAAFARRFGDRPAWASVMISGIGARPEQAILYCAQVNPAAATAFRTVTGSVPSKVFAKMPSFITRHP